MGKQGRIVGTERWKICKVVKIGKDGKIKEDGRNGKMKNRE